MKPVNFDKNVFDSLLELFPGHVFWMDEKGVILGSNDLQAKTLGFNHKEDLIGRNVSDILTPQNAQIILENNQKIIDANSPNMFEEHNDQTVQGDRYYQVHKIPLRQDGKAIGVLGVSTDITDQKLKEKLETENAALLKANDTMRFWAGAIAHEVRTPLFSIGMMADALGTFIENLLRDYPDLWADSPRQRQGLEHIKKIPKNFEEVIKSLNNFVDMSLMKVSPEKTKMYELKPLEINTSVQGMMAAYPFKPYRGDKSERDLVHVNIDQNFTFNGEETLFKHLIYNLLKNAIFFIRKAGKGEIWIESVEGKPGDGFNYLILKDTGPGIPADIVPHLFKAFFSRSQNGTGVGLSLCRTIMQEFGGSISCESVEGEFTKFVMKFPKI